MKREIKTYEYRCDGCHEKTIKIGSDLPPDWGIRTIHGCGMTGYSKDLELCPKCLRDSKNDS